MKLAEALILRGDLQKKIESLRSRIAAYATVQQGDKPHEDPDKLMAEVDGILSDLESLVAKINKTNLSRKIKDGRTLTDALAARDVLKLRHSVLRSAIEGSTRQPERYASREIRWVATMNVAKLQKKSEDVAKKFREINAMIQESNWKHDLDE